MTHIVLLLSYFLKFYVGMIWYRCFAEGNLAELTGKILLIRTIFDFVFIYPILVYFRLSGSMKFNGIYNFLLVATFSMMLFFIKDGYIRAK